MGQLNIQFSKTIPSNPANIYAVLSDYHFGHPAILPRPYFSQLVVEQGGQGAGTILEVHMNVYGTKRVFREIVSEPEPGRVLVETDVEAGVTTTFTIEPLDHGNQAKVTIATQSRTSPGLMGVVESIFQPMIVRRIYDQQLRLLADYVRHGL